MFLGNIAAAWFGLAANHTCSVSETGKLEFVSGTDIPSARDWILEFIFLMARRLAWLLNHGIVACQRIRYLTDLPSARNWIPASCGSPTFGLVDEPWRVRSRKVGVVSETDIPEVQGIRSLTDILSARYIECIERESDIKLEW